jgi:hypothetical protein
VGYHPLLVADRPARRADSPEVTLRRATVQKPIALQPLARSSGLAPTSGDTMRIGRNVEVRPLGGRAGCFAMILFSVLASVILTVVANLLLR